MYIHTKSKQIPCEDFNANSENPIFYGLAENPIGAGDATLTLCRDDGFELFSCVVSDFARAIFSDGTLTLTNEPVLAPILEEVRAAKLAELSNICNATITTGCAVTLSDGAKGHIAMTDVDQINLLAAQAAVQAGQAGYPYHLDGDLCKVYSAADIITMATAATQHKLYHTTYCNHLNVWVRRCETVEAVQAITYGAELPADLAANLAEVLSHAG